MFPEAEKCGIYSEEVTQITVTDGNIVLNGDIADENPLNRPVYYDNEASDIISVRL